MYTYKRSAADAYEKSMCENVESLWTKVQVYVNHWIQLNIVAEGGHSHCEQFFSFLKWFQKPSAADVSKYTCLAERVFTSSEYSKTPREMEWP